ncbi:ABC transporter ATP-binding protein [Capilliphycus salinus ALCB114379]|uniref:ABC transporter ATP-binding protein n=1 Tax=Capilliphycus salinus TaxID=2768948 RepID=UPI0039A512CA
MLQTATQNPGAIGTDSQFDVELRKVFKVFNGETAVRGVDLEVRRGEFFSILGPSGCGKTTTLRLVAGFETPSAGEVLIRGQSMTRVPPYLRPVNTVFQSYALFSHLNVRDNIAFGLRVKRRNQSEIEEKVKEALKLVKMEAFASRFPGQMSGGQQQRVALARALVNRPAVLLLDEPLGALDLKLRKQMQVELSNLHKNLGLTFIMVTHDQEEAMSLSDRIAVMHEGRIEQIGTPSEIYERPQTPFVADFIGDTNLFSGRVEALDATSQLIVTETGLKIEAYPSPPTQTTPNSDIQVGDAVVVSVRPEKISIGSYPVGGAVNCFEGRIVNTMYLGTHLQYIVQLLSGEQLTVQQSKTGEAIAEGETTVYVCWKPTDCLALSQ